ncbi:GGDEF domain protein [Fulvivirga imtechensis AK7]|uniref:histidine kinase n=2 Tax=Fulvivirga TaxID=396811 RepID=L8K1U4_9BACT|nr:GGDEF domain protein [Fulvivirga imtechensis AK7]
MYDGYNFKIFRNDANDSTTISNDLINDIKLDVNGDIWLATYGGLNLYDREYGVFKRFLHDPANNQSLSGNVVNALLFDSKGRLWVGTSYGLNLFIKETGTFKRYVQKDGEANSLIHDNIANSAMIEDHLGNLWIGTHAGISYFNPETEKFINYKHDREDITTISCSHVTSFYEDSDKTIWVGTFCGGINRFNPSDSTFVRYPYERTDSLSLSDSYVTSINEDAEGQLLINTDNGLNVMNRKTGVFKKYFHDPENVHSLSSNITTCTFIDVNNRLWVGTRFGGINIFDKDKYSFKHIRHKGGKGLSNNNVTSFAEDQKGNYWVGTDGGGVNYFDRGKNDFTKLLMHRADKPNSIGSNKVLALEVDRSGNLWIGSWAGGVTVYNPETDEYRHYKNNPDDPNSLSGDYIFDIMEDSQGNIWIGTWNNGFSRYNKDKDNFTQYTYKNDRNDISYAIVVCMYEDHLGKIWVGTGQNGLDMFDPITEKFTHYGSSGINNGSLPVNSIYSLYEDSKNRLWIGTNGGGLCMFNRETATFEVFRKQDGLPNNVIMGILEDNNTNIWLSTNEGLSMFNPEEKTFKNYGLHDGLQSNQFNRWAYRRLSTGELLFGGINGYNMFLPENIKSNEYIPPVYITELRLFNQVIPVSKDGPLRKSLLYTSQITFNYKQNYINLDYVALNYRKSYNNQYKYILEGLQDHWIEAGPERKATYTNLDPGEYIFKVKGSNNDGVWNEDAASLKIIITPPFWDTWFFKVAVALLAVGILISVYLVRMRVVKAQKAALELQVQEKTQSLTKINRELDQFAYVVSHDLKAPLRGIASLSEWIEEDLEENTNEEVKSNFTLLKSRVSRMKDLIDGILQYSRVGRMSAEKETVSSGELINEVLSILSIPDGFNVEVTGDFPVIQTNRTWTEQVFTNLISNAIKYHNRDTGNITIAYHSDQKFHYFSVKDDGPGIAEEYHEKIFMIFQTLQPKDTTESTGIGLSIVKKIIEEQGGSIWVESDGINGSKFIFTLPK